MCKLLQTAENDFSSFLCALSNLPLATDDVNCYHACGVWLWKQRESRPHSACLLALGSTCHPAVTIVCCCKMEGRVQHIDVGFFLLGVAVRHPTGRRNVPTGSGHYRKVVFTCERLAGSCSFVADLTAIGCFFEIQKVAAHACQ